MWLMWSSAWTAFISSARQGRTFFRAYRPKVVDHIPEDLVFDPEFRLTPFDFGYVLFNYDSEKLEQVPASHRDLLDPGLSREDHPHQPADLLSGADLSLDDRRALWRRRLYRLLAGLAPKMFLAIAASWDEAYGMYTAGEAPIVLSLQGPAPPTIYFMKIPAGTSRWSWTGRLMPRLKGWVS